MNNPFYTYPNYPFHGGYNNFNLYIDNIKRLKDLFDDMREYDGKQLIYMAVGATMEEIIDDDNYKKYNQWRQLFPSYIEDMILKSKCLKSSIIIASPNIFFDPCRYRDPVFISKTDRQFKWTKTSKNTYKSSHYDVTVFVICTKFPSYNEDRSRLVYDKLCELVKKDNICINTDHILQTEDDIVFIKNFYDSLDKLIIEIDGILICNSFATFNINSVYGKSYNNYRMFKELKQIFIKNSDKDNIILSEWVHNTKNITTRSIKGQEKNYISDSFKQLDIGTGYIF